MLPLFSARTRRISKISSCLRMPVAPAISSSLAILVSAEMLISFIADSEIVWAGAFGWPWAGLSAWAGLPAGLSAVAVPADAGASAGAGGAGVSTPAVPLGGG